AQYRFWLGDAFASGGSHGYDHKAMGITARGAWISVERHFRDLGIDAEQPFSVVGIGSMAGDVFGNGMLLSPKIRLVAAFNQHHIFIDPDPDLGPALEERRRLFEAAQGWEHYDPALISAGGGVFSRTAKQVPISDAMKRRLRIQADQLSANELIRALLQAPVELLWNG
uniref:NAD-glutamate dehydrogenase domain-containing protein n=1 Tax=Altererythrobacter sp. TaxID=1872480 RepID=UPI003CFEDFB3